MPSQIYTSRKRGYFAKSGPLVIAHRGASGEAPENTLESFERAVRAGADILEMDVHFTTDGHIVVFHDDNLERTTNGSGPIASRPLSEIKQLDAGYRFTEDGGKSFPFRGKGITIPTFREVLDTFPDMPMNVEIKVNRPEFTHKFLCLIAENNRVEDVMVLAAGDSHSLVKRIRALEPKVLTGHSRREVQIFLLLSKLGLPFLFNPGSPIIQVPEKEGWIQVVTPNFVLHAHKLGMKVHVWVANEKTHMERLLAMGVDGIFTDFPGRMRQLVDSMNNGWR